MTPSTETEGRGAGRGHGPPPPNFFKKIYIYIIRLKK
jgi:hypothetical protein